MKRRFKSMTTAIKSVSVSLEMCELAQKYNISLTEAVRVGISMMLAEAGETKYINKLNVYRKIQQLSGVIEGLINKIENKNVILEKTE
jgi:post-segregation antitoxin (ccd killing protein)